MCHYLCSDYLQVAEESSVRSTWMLLLVCRGKQHVLGLFRAEERAAFKRIMSGRLSFYCHFTSLSQTNMFFCLLDEVPSHSHLVFALRKTFKCQLHTLTREQLCVMGLNATSVGLLSSVRRSSQVSSLCQCGKQRKNEMSDQANGQTLRGHSQD